MQIRGKGEVMEVGIAMTAQTKAKIRRQNSIKRKVDFIKRVFKSPGAKFGAFLLVALLVITIFAPVFAPYDPFEMDMTSIYSAPSLKHLCGTDELGRDLLSRLIYGGRWSLTLGLTATAVGTFFGIVLGSIAGYFGGRVENLIMRFCDIWSSIPGMLLTLLIASSLSTGFASTILALSIGPIPNGARMTRALILVEREKEYIEAAKVSNCSNINIMFTHLLPNVISPTIVGTTMQMGGTITMAAGLSYLGFGIQPPTPEWGALLAAGTTKFQAYPYLLLFPGIFLGICVLSFNLIGDGLRDALDPSCLD